MQCFLCELFTPGQATIFVAVVAGWLVLMCLKTIAIEVDYASRWHKLKLEAQILRAKQLRRLKELDIKSGQSR
jgi:hypothetical protein